MCMAATVDGAAIGIMMMLLLLLLLHHLQQGQRFQQSSLSQLPLLRLRLKQY